MIDTFEDYWESLISDDRVAQFLTGNDTDTHILLTLVKRVAKDAWNNGYEIGYGNGKQIMDDSGYDQGFQDGYDSGVIDSYE